MTDIERLKNLVSELAKIADKIDGILSDVEAGRDADKETIERLEEEVADLTSDLEDARRPE